MAVLAVDLKVVEQSFTDILAVAQLEVPSLLLYVYLFVVYKVSLKCGHLRLVEQRAVWSAPQVPEEVAGISSFVVLGALLVGEPYYLFYALHKFFAFVALALYLDFAQCAIFVQGHRCVEEQVRIAHGVHSSVCEQALHVALQSLACAERADETVHNLLLLFVEAIGILLIYRGEVSVLDGVDFTIVFYCTFLEVHLFEQTASLHIPVGILHVELRFEFELYYGNCLVHLCYETLCLLTGRIFAVEVDEGFEYVAGVVGICLHCEGGKGHHIYAVSVLQCLCVCVSQRKAYNRCCAGRVAGGSSHPQYIVVAPLYVKIVIVAEGVHYKMCTGTAVEDVAEYVQTVYRQTLDKVA